MIFEILRMFLVFYFGFKLARSDLKFNKIPDKITFPLIVIGIVLNYFQFGISKYLVYSYLILLGTYFFYVVLYKVLKLINSNQTIGGGDVKYSLAIASLIPFAPFFIYNIFILKVIFIAFILMFSMALTKLLSILILNKVPNKAKIIISTTIMDTKVAFAPLLFLASIIAMFV